MNLFPGLSHADSLMTIRSPRRCIEDLMDRLERRAAPAPFTDPTGRKTGLGKFARAPKHQVRRVEVRLVGSPRRPLRILFLSDIHLGSHPNDLARLELIVAEGASLSPDLVCIGGDYVNGLLFGGGRVPPRTTAEILSRIRAPLGIYGVLGDHDETYGAGPVCDALGAAGIRVLTNELVTLVVEESELSLVGVLPGATDLPRLLASNPIGRPTVIIAHDPAAFAHVPPGPNLMLSGHTHGGQIRVPLVGPLVNLSEAPLRWTHGHVIEGGRQLYVTSGIGTSLLPIRIGVAPEIVLIEIVDAGPRH